MDLRRGIRFWEKEWGLEWFGWNEGRHWQVCEERSVIRLRSFRELIVSPTSCHWQAFAHARTDQSLPNVSILTRNSTVISVYAFCIPLINLYLSLETSHWSVNCIWMSSVASLNVHFAFWCLAAFESPLGAPRERWRLQNGWIFGKFQTAFDPSLHFRKILMQFFPILCPKSPV